MGNMKIDFSNAAPDFNGYNVTSVESGDYIAIKPSVWGSLEDMRWFRVEAVNTHDGEVILDIITDSGTYGIEDVCDIRLRGEVQGLD